MYSCRKQAITAQLSGTLSIPISSGRRVDTLWMQLAVAAGCARQLLQPAGRETHGLALAVPADTTLGLGIISLRLQSCKLLPQSFWEHPFDGLDVRVPGCKGRCIL